MKHDDLPERWKTRIKDYLRSQGIDEREVLTENDFFDSQIAKFKFEDNSYAEFYYPLVIEAPDLDEVGVFTEHCGYHIFNLAGTQVNIESV